MSPVVRILIATVAALAGTLPAPAQISSPQSDANQPQPSSLPVAYVYVSSNPTSGKYQINAYAAAPTGALTNVSGSPFSSTVQEMALNGKWLFGTNGININSFSIGANGALHLADTYTAGNQGGGPGFLFLDHTGADLYDGYINLNGTGNNGYQAYRIDQTTGKITFINQVAAGPDFGSPLSFTGNNVYAYSSGCYHFTPAIYGLKRSGNGSVSQLNINPPLPNAPPGDFYCPYLAAADPTNHVAVPVQPYKGWSIDGAYQLATYTANAAGDLSTTSTYSNMPKVAVGSVSDVRMSPSGKLVAVAGTSGLQVFHFNGANPITHYTGLLTTSPVNQMFWDNANHLYAISSAAGKLYVFTVTPTGFSQAPGSPHTIAHPEFIIVLPKT